MHVQLDRVFRDLCRDYFPEWKEARAWAIEPRPIGRLRANGEVSWLIIGYCEVETRTIYILDDYVAFGGSILRRLILHEICHAIGFLDHEADWQRAFRGTAPRALQLGDPVLAEAIAREVWSHEADPGCSSADQVRFDIRELVHSRPTAPFRRVIQLCAFYYDSRPSGLAIPPASQRTAFARARDEAALKAPQPSLPTERTLW